MLTKFLKKTGLHKLFGGRDKKCDKKPCLIVPRSQHNVSRSRISKPALKVLYRLRDAGFEAYLVGGGIRDILLNRDPKDFDIATNARPEQIQRIFNNCRLIGRRFRLAHIYFNYQVIEVATFRAAAYAEESHVLNKNLTHSETGMIVRDNIYGTLEEDVQRRDFTINAIYYNIADFTLVDYVGGLSDLNAKILRVIGDPASRYREDPVRMLRIIRFSAKLDFQIEKQSETPIFELKYLLNHVPSARLFDEYLKMFLSGNAYSSFELLRKYKILEILFPQTEAALQDETAEKNKAFIHLALKGTDKRFIEEKPITPVFLLAVLLWPAVEKWHKINIEQGLLGLSALYDAANKTIGLQQKHVAIPKRILQMMRDIWLLQYRLQKRSGKRAFQIFVHPKFRAAYDFCLLRAEVGEGDAIELAHWWTEFVEADQQQRQRMVLNFQKLERKLTVRGRSKKKQKKIEFPPAD